MRIVVLLFFLVLLNGDQYLVKQQIELPDTHSAKKPVGIKDALKQPATWVSTKLHVLPISTGKTLELSQETSLQILHLISETPEFIPEESDDYVFPISVYQLQFESRNGDFLSLYFDDYGTVRVNVFDHRDISGITDPLNSFLNPYGIELSSNEEDSIDFTKPTMVQMYFDERTKDIGFWKQIDLKTGSSILENIKRGTLVSTVELGSLAQENELKFGVMQATFSEKRTCEIRLFSHETWIIDRGYCLIFDTSSQNDNIAKLMKDVALEKPKGAVGN